MDKEKILAAENAYAKVFKEYRQIPEGCLNIKLSKLIPSIYFEYYGARLFVEKGFELLSSNEMRGKIPPGHKADWCLEKYQNIKLPIEKNRLEIKSSATKATEDSPYCDFGFGEKAEQIREDMFDFLLGIAYDENTGKPLRTYLFTREELATFAQNPEKHRDRATEYRWQCVKDKNYCLLCCYSNIEDYYEDIPDEERGRSTPASGGCGSQEQEQGM